jgi:hypothetical protein
MPLVFKSLAVCTYKSMASMTILSEKEPLWIFDCLCTEKAGSGCGYMTEKISRIQMQEPKEIHNRRQGFGSGYALIPLFLEAGSGAGSALE